MKYILVLSDGMADLPLKELNNITCLEAANTPNMDELSQKSLCGMVKTVPDGFSPGSDTANLSVMGYSPKKYYSGRSPIEAASIGVNLDNDDLTFRMNFVNIDFKSDYMNATMIDHGADEITTNEASILLESIKKEFTKDNFDFYKGTSYRHLLVSHKDTSKYDLTPPHDILGKSIANYLPKGDNSQILIDMMQKSYDILNDHPVNLMREKKGLKKANSIWFWGPGTKLDIPSFESIHNKKGAVISAVDLIKGIGVSASMHIKEVEGITGTFHTNYLGKGNAAIDILKEGYDFVFVHIEAPDESGHKGDIKEKIASIENVDNLVIKTILSRKDEIGDFKMIVMPDHPTPISIRTHTSDPVPFLLYDSTNEIDGIDSFSEKNCQSTNIFIEEGHKLILELIK